MRIQDNMSLVVEATLRRLALEENMKKSSVERYEAFVDEVNALSKKYCYSCIFESSPIFDDSFEVNIEVEDETFRHNI